MLGGHQLPHTLNLLMPSVLVAMASVPSVMSGRGGIDLSVGPLLGFVNVVVVAVLLPHRLGGVWAAIPIALGIGAGVGLVNGAVVAYGRLQPVVVTLSSYLVLGGASLVIMPQPAGADAGADQSLVALAGGGGVHHRGDGADADDLFETRRFARAFATSRSRCIGSTSLSPNLLMHCENTTSSMRTPTNVGTTRNEFARKQFGQSSIVLWRPGSCRYEKFRYAVGAGGSAARNSPCCSDFQSFGRPRLTTTGAQGLVLTIARAWSRMPTATPESRCRAPLTI